MAKLEHTEFTLKDVICTPGFQEAFKRMARYSLRTKKEALIDVKIPFYPLYKDLVYDMMYGNEETIEGNGEDIKYRITHDGSLNTDITSGLGAFSVHTHPDAPKEQPNRYLRFSEPDINGHINRPAATWYNPLGVAILPKPDHARCLIWQPKTKFIDETQLGEKLDELAMLETPTAVVEELRKYGKADLIDFEHTGKIWLPKQEKKLEAYAIKYENE